MVVAHNNGPSLKQQQLTKGDVAVLVDKCINFVYVYGRYSLYFIFDSCFPYYVLSATKTNNEKKGPSILDCDLLLHNQSRRSIVLSSNYCFLQCDINAITKR